MNASDLIRRKRDGEELDAKLLQQFVAGIADDSIPAEQIAAFTMAVFFQSMSFAEAGALTLAMANSGDTLSWDADVLGGPIVDKHSTGGVGDKVSFLLAPIAAACGLYVPMISGRGLGHSGGTLDKIGSIPGYNATPDLERFRKVVAETGSAIIGQTAELAPADKRVYAVRDITATVESVPLITASILSKKIAAGNQGLVMDIKWGTGAFMDSVEQATTLARSLIETAATAGLTTHALITDMNEVLGFSAGNALEIEESLAFLEGSRQEPRLRELTLNLVAEMLCVGGLADNPDEGLIKASEALDRGYARERFAKMIHALGGPSDVFENRHDWMPEAPVVQNVLAGQSGYLGECDARAIGMSIIELGGGRRRQDDVLDLSVGFSECLKTGSRVEADTVIAQVHASNSGKAEAACAAYQNAVSIVETCPTPTKLLESRLLPNDKPG